MSVPAWNRSKSEMDFITYARKLEIYTKKKCSHFKKSYTFYEGLPLANLAQEIHHTLIEANSYYPLNKEEAQIRRNCMLKARATIKAMISELEVAKEVIPTLDYDTFEYWSGMCYDVLRLTNGVIQKDRERYKNLP